MTDSAPETGDDKASNVARDPDDGPPLTRRDLQDRAIHGALWTLLNVFLGVGVGFLVNILLARVLRWSTTGV